jgi:transcriptional regulator with XRE-family HTH domain
MFINKAVNGDNNICGKNIAALRKAAGLSQNQLAGQLQLRGLDVDKNAIQRIEAGKRFVTDIELVYLADVLKVGYDALLDRREINTDPIDR